MANRARRGPLADLLNALYEESGYTACVLAMENGPLRRANLERLCDLARQSDSFARQGLSRFLEFIEQIRDANEDYDEASVQGAAEDVVRIMTVHKSKGLEFPIVFVSNLSRKFNAKDYLGSLALDRNRACVFRWWMSIWRTFTTPAQEYIWRGKKKQALAEEMRVLYVALTRARERLVLSGTVKDLEKNRERWTKLAEAARPDDTRPGRNRLPAHQMNISAPGGLMDWIGAALTLNPRSAASTHSPPPRTSRCSPSDGWRKRKPKLGACPTGTDNASRRKKRLRRNNPMPPRHGRPPKQRWNASNGSIHTPA